MEHCCDLEELDLKKSYSNRAELNEDVDLMWLLVWTFFMHTELRIQIAELSCLHVNVCKMYLSQVHWRESECMCCVNATPPSPDT